MFFIVDSHGDSLFSFPYSLDFCIHCLCLLVDRFPLQEYKLMSVDLNALIWCGDKVKRTVE